MENAEQLCLWPWTLTTPVVKAAPRRLITSVGGGLATNPAFTAAITTEVRQATPLVTEAVLFEEEVPLPASLQATLTGVTGDVTELRDGSRDSADLTNLSN